LEEWSPGNLKIEREIGGKKKKVEISVKSQNPKKYQKKKRIKRKMDGLTNH